jgi:sugar-specific transcriptional regulator TrmB
MSKRNQALFFREKSVQLLTQLGLSPTQARLYESILERGKGGGTALGFSKNMGLPRSEIYRALSELQQKGLVEKEVSYPNKFNAIPIATGLQILLSQKNEHYKKLEHNINSFLQKAKSFQEVPLDEEEYKITIVEGKHRILNKISQQHKNAKQSVKILTTLPRWLQIIHYCIRDYEAALNRGVEYLIVVENTEGKFTLPNEIELLLKKPNLKLATCAVKLKTNGAIFDDKEVSINFFPSKSLSESPFIWSNHPSLISMLEDQFEKHWSNSVKYSCV